MLPITMISIGSRDGLPFSASFFSDLDFGLVLAKEKSLGLRGRPGILNGLTPRKADCAKTKRAIEQRELGNIPVRSTCGQGNFHVGEVVNALTEGAI